MGDKLPFFSKEFLATYDIGRKLGEGAFGVVVKGIQRDLDRPVAIKLMLKRRQDSADTKKRFIREARLLAKMSHPNVVKIYAYGTDKNAPYIVEEYLEGFTFDGYLRANKPLPMDKILDVCAQTASALAAAHDVGILHRDLKPENMFILDNGQIKLLDFGLAKRPGQDTEMTKTGMIVGTPMFVAPEQVEGSAVTPATDLYALGTLMFHLISDEWPFETVMPKVLFSKLNNAAPSLETVAPDCAPGLIELVDQMLATKAIDRPQSALDVQKRLQAIAKDEKAGKKSPRVGAIGRVRQNKTAAASELVGVGKGAKKVSAAKVEAKAGKASGATRSYLLAFLLLALLATLVVIVLPKMGGPKETLSISNLSIKAQPTEVTITWVTAKDMFTEGKISDGSGSSRHIAEKSAKRRNHKLVVRGLQSGFTYSFRPVFGDELAMAHEFTVPLPKKKVNASLIKKFRVSNVDVTELSLSLETNEVVNAWVEVKEKASGKTRKVPLGKGGQKFEKHLAQLSETTRYVLTPIVHNGKVERRGNSEVVTTGKAVMKMVLTGFGVKRRQGEFDFTSMWTEKLRTISAPTTWNNRFFAGFGRHGIISMSPKSKKILWWNKKIKVSNAMKVYGDRLFINDGKGGLVCLACSDGKILWQEKGDEKVCSLFLVDEFGVLLWLFGKGGKIYSRKTGRLRGRIPATCERALFVRVKNFVHWIEENGRVLYGANIEANEQDSLATLPDDDGAVSIIAVGDRTFIGSKMGAVYQWHKGELTTLDMRFGVPISRMATDGKDVYVTVRDKSKICAISPLANKVRWSKRYTSDPRGLLLCHQQKLYINLGGTHVYAMATRDGSELWKRYTNIKTSFGLVPIAGGVVCCSGFKDLVGVFDKTID